MGTGMRALQVSLRNGLGPARLPRVLTRAGLRVTVACPRGRFPQASRFAREHVELPSRPPAAVETLRRHLAENEYDRVVLADDGIVTAMLARAGEPWADAVLPVTDPRAVEALLDKTAFLSLAEEERWPVPAWAVCATPDAVAGAAMALGGEVILKALRGSAGTGVRLAEDAEHARALAVVSGTPLLVQRRVPGRTGSIAGLYERGRLVCALTGYKERTYLGRFGPSSAIRIMDLPVAISLAEAIGRRFGYDGFAGIDIIHDPERDTVTLLEFNARPTPAANIGMRVGADFGEALGDVTAERTTPLRVPTRAMHRHLIPLFPEEVIRCLQEHDFVRLGGLLFDASWWRSMELDDPVLMARMLGSLGSEYLQGRGRLRPDDAPARDRVPVEERRAG